MFPAGETVVRLRRGSVMDPYSQELVPSWDAPLGELTIHGCAVEPRPSQEPVQDARNAITSGYTVYLPAGADVTSRDRLQVRGSAHDVLGEPAVWRSPYSGWEPGIVVQCGRVQG